MDSVSRDTMSVSEKLRRDIGDVNFSTFEPLEDCSSFQQRFLERLKRYRPDLLQNAETWKTLINIVLEAAEEKHIDISARSLSAWGPAANTQKQRDPSTSSSTEETRLLAYKICAAMDLNIGQITDFFTSVFLTRAFFVRRTRELLYYYYIVSMEDDWFTKAEAVFAQCQTDDREETDGNIIFTACILDEIDQIENDSALLEYIDANRDSLQSKYIGLTAREKVVGLVQKVWPLICIERQLIERTDDDIAFGDVNYECLLNTILGYHALDAGKLSMSGIPTDALPRQISQAFPNAVYLRRIVGNANVYWREPDREENYSPVQPDITRKMLLLLALYNRFAPQEIAYAMTEVYPKLSTINALDRIDGCYGRGFDLGRTYGDLPEDEKEPFEAKAFNGINRALGRVKEAFVNVKSFERNTNICDDRFTEFIQQTNSLLEKAGFPGLYIRNAYDYLIVYCAVKKRPISALRELLRKLLSSGK